MMLSTIFRSIIVLTSLVVQSAALDRHAVVSRYNPSRSGNATNFTTPMQVGNGRFAFGADLTGLQSILPFSIMSSWGFKNDSLPANRTVADVEDYRGQSWYNHGRLVEYDFGGDPEIEQWLTANPNRVNLGRTGFVLLQSDDTEMSVTADDISNASQTLDLWTGNITSQFTLDGELVTVETFCAFNEDTVSISVSSSLLTQGRLGVFFDFPWNDGSNKFSDPFVGFFNMTANHTTDLTTEGLGANIRAQISHTMNAATFYTSIGGDMFNISLDTPGTHHYTARPIDTNSSSFSLSVSYASEPLASIALSQAVVENSKTSWETFWTNEGFVDVVSASTDSRADELQRRIILSRYLMRINAGADAPPQESGLVNDGWYGKFHMEEIWWHCAHWALWNNIDLLSNCTSVYERFLPLSIWRAQVQQGWSAGARWPKMTDPSGRSAPGEINNLLIWEQPHPIIFATYERRATTPNTAQERAVLDKWRDVIRETADWMAVFAFWNTSTNVYDIGPPMYVVSEDTSPNITMNPAFELAYWRLGLRIATEWMQALGENESVWGTWEDVRGKLAPLPIENGTYAVYEGIPENFWTDPDFTNDHPAMTGLYGWLPPTPGLDINIVNATTHKVWANWNISNCWGWDFAMLAMSAARLGEPEEAIEWLLHPLLQFDDVGMPIGGVRVPTPYFPASGALLLALGMMSAGWENSTGPAPGFPTEGWTVQIEGLAQAL